MSPLGNKRERQLVAHCTRTASRNACPEAVAQHSLGLDGRDRQQRPRIRWRYYPSQLCSFGSESCHKKIPDKNLQGLFVFSLQDLMNGDAIFCKSGQTRCHRQSALPAFSASRRIPFDSDQFNFGKSSTIFSSVYRLH